MTAIVIPVKPFAIAKQRLAPVLNATQRADLALAMLADVLLVATSQSEHDVWVVTCESAATTLAQQHGAGIIPESVVAGYNAAVATGLSFVAQHYSDNQNVAIVPADVPQITVDDLRTLALASDSMPCNPETGNPETGNRTTGNHTTRNPEIHVPTANTVRLAPAHDNEGTNGVFLSRPDLLQPAFGKNSFIRYQQDCRTIGLTPDIYTKTSLAFDIDTAFDLQQLLTQKTDNETSKCLRALPRFASQLINTHVTPAISEGARLDVCP